MHISPRQHGVTVGQLQALVERLSLPPKVWPQEIAEERAAQYRQEQAEGFAQAQRMAAALAEASRGIPDRVSSAGLSDDDRELLLRNAQGLARNAGRLKSIAGRQDLQGARAVLCSMQTACNACHDQLRALAGPAGMSLCQR